MNFINDIENVDLLSDIKTDIEELQAELVSLIGERFSVLYSTIENRIAELEEDDEIEDEDYEDEDESSEETSVQDRVNASLLAQTIANQLQTTGRLPEPDVDTDLPQVEEVPVVEIITSSPTLSLTELIKNQVTTPVVEEAAPVTAEQNVTLSELVAKQVEEQNDLSVVVPATSEGPVEVATPETAPARPMNVIIEELRSSVNAEVETSSEEETNQLVEQAVTSEEGSSTELSQQIKTQILSNEIKKQLS
ncbi:hypothetical protein ABWK22_01525 [Gottfriedia acidiceleris]|uniref:hypothetical protein n=1 Tax=Gottfriedia acidiceleris TaxID=371036 RepID=UPI003391DDBD